MKKYIVISFIFLFLISCEKEIDIDLNQNDPKFVIEGNLSNKAGESKVKISKTLNFDETVPYPAIRGALVTITDNTMDQIDTLSESTAGIYIKSGFAGIEGHTFTMMVKTGNEIFTAVSKMPYSVHFDSLVQENLAGSSTNGGPITFIQITPHYTNLYNFENYYQFVVTRNDTLIGDIFIRNDIGFNGSSSTFPLWVKANKNDIVKIDMQCIDNVVYDYLFGLSENIYQYSATPANPTSNIDNGALGFFKAHTSQKKTISIK